MRTRSSWVAGWAAGIALITALAACSSSASTGGALSVQDSGAPNVTAPTLDFDAVSAKITDIFGAFPTVSGSTTRGATPTSVNLGTVADITIGGAPQYPGLCEGVLARVTQANKDHETKHSINYTGCQDSGGDADRTTAALRTAVDGNNDFAMIWTPNVTSSTDILTREHVPYFGYGTTSDYCGNDHPFAFADSGASICGAVGTATGGKTKVISDTTILPMVKALNLTPQTVKLAIVTVDYPKGKLLVASQANAAMAQGITPVYAESSIPQATTGAVINYAPYVSKILENQPNLIIALIPGPNLVGLLAGLQQAGYRGPVLQALYSDPSVFKNPAVAQAIDGTYGANPLGSPAFSSQAWNTVKAAASAVSASAQVGTLGFGHGYASADMFVQGLKAFEATGKDLTTENFTNFINAGWKYPGVSNVVGPVVWPASHYVGNGCSSILQISTKDSQIKGVYDLHCNKITFQDS